MDRPRRAPCSRGLKVALAVAVACTATLLVCLDPRGQYDRDLANLCAAALALTALSWAAVLGVWLRDSTLARHAEQRGEARAELADTRRAILDDLALLRDEVARHDRRVAALIQAITEYGDERHTAALVSVLSGNGGGVAAKATPSLFSVK